MTSKKKKVLIVDDETFILELIRDFLELKNIDSDMAKDPKTALELLKKNQYELLLVDKNLQDSQGESLISEIKKLKTKILISEDTYERVKDMKRLEFVDHGPQGVKGRKEKIRIYEVKRPAK